MAVVRTLVVDHVLFVVRDLGASRAFFSAALEPLGSSLFTNKRMVWPSG
jgi:hypothetical protein